MNNPSANEKVYLEEVQGAFREMTSCLKTMALYPEDHPAQAPALDRAYQRLQGLLSERESLSLGVSQEEIVLFGEGDKEHRLSLEMAQRLHQQGILTLRMDRGVSREDLKVFLGCLARSPEVGGSEEDMARALERAGVRAIAVSFVDYRRIIEQEAESLVGAGKTGKNLDFWSGLIQQARQGEDSALEKLADSLADASRFPDLNRAIRGHLSELVLDDSVHDRATLLATLHQQVFHRLSPDEQQAFAANLAGLALTEELDPSEGGAQLAQAFMAYPDEMLLKVLAGAVAQQGKVDNRITSLLQTLAPDQKRQEALHRAADAWSRGKGPEGYAPETWRQISRLFLSGSEDRFMSKEYHQVLQDLNRYHLDELRETIREDYLREVQAALEPQVLRKIRRDLVFDLIRQLDRPELMEGTPGEIGLILAEYARNLEMGAILEILQGLFDPRVPLTPEKRKILETSLFGARDNPWLPLLVREIGTFGEAELSSFKQILSYATDGLAEILIRQLAEEGSISGRKRLSSLLVELGQKAVPAIVEALDDPRWFLVRNLVMILGKIGDPSCVEDLLVLLSHEHFRVRKEVLLTLSLIGGDRAVPQIRRVLLNRSRRQEPAVQTAAALALKRIATPKSRKVLQEGLEDKDKKVQEVCCQVIKGLL